MSRTYPPRPILAVGGLLVRDGSMLLIKRGKEPGLGMWSIPGGAIKTGETLADGLIREMMEEVNLEVKVGPLVEIIERIFPDEGGKILYHYVIMDYLCICPEGDPKPGSDAADTAFAKPEEWPNYGLAATSRILKKAMDMALKI